MALQLAKICTKKGKKRVYIPVKPSDTADCSQLSDQEVMANLPT